MTPQSKTLLLLKPRGFCAGVVRAIDIVRIALDAFGPPIYVRKEIVHNRYVVEELKAKGAIFVDEVDEVPDGQRLIYSAHGVSPTVREASKLRNLRVVDATCPLVTKVHVEAVKYAKGGYSIILIGHRDHDEVIGTLEGALRDDGAGWLFNHQVYVGVARPGHLHDAVALFSPANRR